jgi:hypothetical protein
MSTLFFPADIPHPWYSRPRIKGPVPFHGGIANSLCDLQSPTADGLLLHATAQASVLTVQNEDNVNYVPIPALGLLAHASVRTRRPADRRSLR